MADSGGWKAIERSRGTGRAVMAGLALVGILALSGPVRAQFSTPPVPPVPGPDDSRFGPLAHPVITLTGATPPADPDAVVSATVVFSGDSVSTAQARAARTHRPFDAAVAEGSVERTQARTVPELQAAGATVDATITNVLNAVTVHVKVRDLDGLAQVAGVAQVHVSRTIQRDNGTSNAYTGATAVWNSLGRTGAGVSIAVIDDGIDYTHADFGTRGAVGDAARYTANNPKIIEAGTFPTVKVIGGYDFVGDRYSAGASAIACNTVTGSQTTRIACPDVDPLACGEHGTHVSGTAAGYGVLADGTTYAGGYDTASLSGQTFKVAPGSAPMAKLYMYKVFGCEGGTSDTVILAALDQAMAITGADRPKVLNMSLGSSWGTADEPIALALDAVAQSGILPVVSAGNSGAGPYVVAGPGTADRALSVAAADTSSSTVPGVAVTGGITYSAQNSNSYDFAGSGSVTGQLIAVNDGCDDTDFSAASGKIAVATRGGRCGRTDRLTLAQAAGARAVIFINNVSYFPPVEGPIAGVTIPFVGVNPDDAQAASFRTSGTSVTLGAAAPVTNPGYERFASFSSNGPRSDNALKPDIAAPGVAVVSASVGSGTAAIVLSGTSMASPHTAGIAALVAEAHPSWSPAEIKGALMATATASRVLDYDTVRGGTGMVAAAAAVASVATITTSDGLDNLSFGIAHISTTLDSTRPFTIENWSGQAIVYDLSTAHVIDLGLGAALSITFDHSTVTVPAASGTSPNIVPGTALVNVSLHLGGPAALPTQETSRGVALKSISGLVVATPRSAAPGVVALTVPFLLVPYGVSDVTANAISARGLDAIAQTPTSLKVSNRGTHAGYYDTYQWAISDSVVDTSSAETPNVADVGVKSYTTTGNVQLVVFAIRLDQPFATMGMNYFDVFINTDSDPAPEYELLAKDDGLVSSGTPNGIMSAYLFPYGSSTPIDALTSFAPYNGTVIEIPVRRSLLGSGGAFSFTVTADSVVAAVPADTTVTGRFDPSAPALNNADYGLLAAGSTVILTTTIHLAAAKTQGALGWLIVSVDDATDSTVDRVPLLALRPTRAPA